MKFDGVGGAVGFCCPLVAKGRTERGPVDMRLFDVVCGLLLPPSGEGENRPRPAIRGGLSASLSCCGVNSEMRVHVMATYGYFVNEKDGVITLIFVTSLTHHLMDMFVYIVSNV